MDKGKLLLVPSRGLIDVFRFKANINNEKFWNLQINNLEEFERLLGQMKGTAADKIPFAINGTDSLDFAEIKGYNIFDKQLSLVYRKNDPEMKLLAWEQTPEYAEILIMFDRWVKQGYIMPGKPSHIKVMSYLSETGMNHFDNLDLLGYIRDGYMDFRENNYIKVNENKTIERISIERKTNYLDEGLVHTRIPDVNTQAGCICFPDYSKLTERALMFIDELFSDQIGRAHV